MAPCRTNRCGSRAAPTAPPGKPASGLAVCIKIIDVVKSMKLLRACLLFFGLCNVSTATRALVADLSKDASASQTGKPSGGNAHVGSCFVETRQSNGAAGEHCSGKLWLQRDDKPGNTGYYKFRNINGKGMIACVMPMHSCRRC